MQMGSMERLGDPTGFSRSMGTPHSEKAKIGCASHANVARLGPNTFFTALSPLSKVQRRACACAGMITASPQHLATPLFHTSVEGASLVLLAAYSPGY
jgi:hypothetical protein